MKRKNCQEHHRLIEFVSVDSGKLGCHLCVAFGELRQEKVVGLETVERTERVEVGINKESLGKMSIKPPFDVKVLSISSPAFISVRPVQWEEAAFEMQQQLSSFYTLSDPQPSAIVKICVGSVCAARCGNKWFRAVVVSMVEGEIDTVTVRLVDLGKIEMIKVENLKLLYPHFIPSPALAIICHLHGLQHWSDKEWLEEQVITMKNMLPVDQDVTMIHRGGPIMNNCGGHYSLPVDLIWEEIEMPDPFLPKVVTEFSLTKLVAVKFGVTGHDELNDTVEVDNSDEMNSEDIVNEFSHVEPLQQTENFRWLDPEIPPSTQFTARGTFVDGSGQIYIQLHAQRHTVRVLRRLLNEKFSDSQPDCQVRKLRPMDECCVRWRDGNWYRARFIKYFDTDQQEGLVMLVDYGNLYQVEVEDIRSIIYGERIPIQCMRTVLAGLEPVGGSWSQDCLDFIQEKINYAKLERNYKLRVKVVEKSEAQPFIVSMTDKSSQGVVVDLAQMLVMLFTEDVTMVKSLHALPDPLSLINKSLSWSVVPTGHYKQSNPYLLLCPQYSAGTEQVATIPTIDWDMAGLTVGQMLLVKLADIESFNQVYVHPIHPTSAYLSKLATQHVELSKAVQAECEVKPPVLQPRPGLLVAVRWARDGWFRAVIGECTDTAVFVK